MKTKKDRAYSFHHTRDRLKERYGIDLDMEGYNHICEKVKHRKDTVLIEEEYQHGDVQQIFDLHYPYLDKSITIREKIRVVWSQARQYITTALPLP